MCRYNHVLWNWKRGERLTSTYSLSICPPQNFTKTDITHGSTRARNVRTEPAAPGTTAFVCLWGTSWTHVCEEGSHHLNSLIFCHLDTHQDLEHTYPSQVFGCCLKGCWLRTHRDTVLLLVRWIRWNAHSPEQVYLHSTICGAQPRIPRFL